MTLQTHTATDRTVLANTAVFRALVTAIVALTLMLTGWTAVQAKAVEDAISGNGPEYPSIRQLERAAQDDVAGPEHPSIRQLERVTAGDATTTGPVWTERIAQLEATEHTRFTNRVAVADVGQFAGVTDEDLRRLERQEERRFRNGVPA